MIEHGRWRMWHDSCVRWIEVDGKPEPLYRIAYAESTDGVIWVRSGLVCIDFDSPEEAALTRPCVIREQGRYRMWFAKRSARDYRTNPAHSYRLGYAESKDGIHWDRKDQLAGIDVSPQGWDSTMLGLSVRFRSRRRQVPLLQRERLRQNGFRLRGLGLVRELGLHGPTGDGILARPMCAMLLVISVSTCV